MPLAIGDFQKLFLEGHSVVVARPGPAETCDDTIRRIRILRSVLGKLWHQPALSKKLFSRPFFSIHWMRVCKGTLWVPFKMLRERLPTLSAMTLDQIGAKNALR